MAFFVGEDKHGIAVAGVEAALATTFDICSNWAVNYRVMPDETRYSLAAYPYVKDILNARNKYLWVMKGAQTGLTEAFITRGLFEIDYHGRDVIHYFPTLKMAERFSKTRYASAINDSPYLKKVVTNNSIELKQIGTATVNILGAGSMANLKGTASGRLLLDELDEWTAHQIYLAEQRAAGQKGGDKIIAGISTPKWPNLGVHKFYMPSTRERFQFKCPHCDKTEMLMEGMEVEDLYRNFKLCGDRVDDPDVHRSYIFCSWCKKELPFIEYDKHTNPEGVTKPWLSDGWWQVTNPEADPEHRGFWVSQLYSPTVEPWEIAVAVLRGHGDEEGRRELNNSVLGLPYIEDSAQVNDAHIDACVSAKPHFSHKDPKIRPKTRSDGIYTLGIDQGGQFHHWVAVKWMFDRDRKGDPNDRAIGYLQGFGRIPQDNWDEVHGLMRMWQCRMAVIDFFPDPTDARVFARKFNGFVYLCQYTKGQSGRELTKTEDEYGANLVKVSRVGWMSKALGRVMSGDIVLPNDVNLTFRDQIKAPIRTMKKVDGEYVA